MATFKCKMCGGTLEITENQTVCECEYCGTSQTLPRLNDDKKANLYDRANHFRRNNEFDKAMGIFEQILNEDSTDSEAYWSIVLCRYGIEYVEDPATKKRIPTVNRAQYTSIFDDGDYKSAIEYADSLQKTVYEEEAKTINEIQKGILEISQKEEPFDVFICYKETDNNGRRTQDSVLANDLYHQLTQEGFKVFFSRITLEDKLGTAYEPYIFAALNSAKVMVVLGTKPEYFNAVWVRNEWSRYLALVKQSQGKKMLIPAYRDMDPYDLPEEFSHLQAQDMGKLGFMQDLIRGIKKIIGADISKADERKKVVESERNIERESSNINFNIAPLLKRVFMFLEDGDFKSADEYCEKVLDLDPECAEAYLGKLMVELKVKQQDLLKDCSETFEDSKNYKKVFLFGTDKLKKMLADSNRYIVDRNEEERKTQIYNSLLEKLEKSFSNEELIEIASGFESISGFKNSDELAKECREKAEEIRKNKIYNNGITYMKRKNLTGNEKAVEVFSEIKGYKNTDELIEECKQKIIEIKNENLADGINLQKKDTIDTLRNAVSKFTSIRGWKNADELTKECETRIAELEIEEKRKNEEIREQERRRGEEIRKREAIAREKEKKKNKMIKITIIVLIFVCATFITTLDKVIIPNNKYKKGIKCIENGEYDEAIDIFESLGEYKDAKEKILSVYYEKGKQLLQAEQYHDAVYAFRDAGDYEDAKEQILLVYYEKGKKLLQEGKYERAISAFMDAGDYEDAKEQILLVYYEKGKKLLQEEKYEQAINAFKVAEDKEDLKKQILEICYTQGNNLLNSQKYSDAIYIFESIDNYMDAKEKLKECISLKIKNAQRGDVIRFGKYDWRVIERKDDELFLLSVICIDYKAISPNKSKTWEHCTLRYWLNNEFYNAFSDDEKKQIKITHVENKDNKKQNTKGGNDTEDRIFLLSIEEARNLHLLQGGGQKSWWLRTPGRINIGEINFSEVKNGIIESSGASADELNGVRPAMWISIE